MLRRRRCKVRTPALNAIVRAEHQKAVEASARTDRPSPAEQDEAEAESEKSASAAAS